MPLIGPPYDQFFVSCDEMPYQRTGTPYSLTGSRRHERKHKVVVKYKEMNSVDVCLCPGVPLPGTLYTTIPPAGLPYVGYDLLALLVEQKAEQQDGDDWAVWIVTSTYSTDIPTRVPGGNTVAGAQAGAAATSNNPESELPVVEWDFEAAQEYELRDLNGMPYTNSAHHLLTPGPPIDRSYPVLSITRNEPNFSFTRANKFAQSVNESPYLGVPRGCVLCLPPKSQQKQRGMRWYWRTSYRLKFRCVQDNGGYILPTINVLLFNATTRKYEAHAQNTELVDEWQALVLDKGMYRLGSATRTPPDAADVIGKNIIHIQNPFTKQPVSHDMCLNGAGQESTNPAGTALDVPIEVWYKQFKTRHYRDFNELIVEGLG